MQLESIGNVVMQGPTMGSATFIEKRKQQRNSPLLLSNLLSVRHHLRSLGKLYTQDESLWS